jgi:hypothetical protein
MTSEEGESLSNKRVLDDCFTRLLISRIIRHSMKSVVVIAIVPVVVVVVVVVVVFCARVPALML